jgi:hypothetical protein
LLVALGGTSYATVLNVPRNSVGTPQLKRNAVKPSKLAPNAVRTAHVLNGSLLAADFKPGQLPAGPKGEKGDKGDPGPVGVSGWRIVHSLSSSNSSTSRSGTANCPSGTRVLGGGGSLVGSEGPAIVASAPAGPVFTQGTGWSMSARELVPTAGNWSLSVYAVCASVS